MHADVKVSVHISVGRTYPDNKSVHVGMCFVDVGNRQIWLMYRKYKQVLKLLSPQNIQNLPTPSVLEVTKVQNVSTEGWNQTNIFFSIAGSQVPLVTGSLVPGGRRRSGSHPR